MTPKNWRTAENLAKIPFKNNLHPLGYVAEIQRKVNEILKECYRERKYQKTKRGIGRIRYYEREGYSAEEIKRRQEMREELEHTMTREGRKSTKKKQHNKIVNNILVQY